MIFGKRNIPACVSAALCILILSACTQKGESDVAHEDPVGDREVVDLLSYRKADMYAFLWAREENPVDTASSTEVIRLHYEPRFASPRTYSISRDSGIYVPFGNTGMVRYTGWRFRLYTKASGVASWSTIYSTNVIQIDEDIEYFEASWDGLIALIDSTGVFKMRDSRLNPRFGDMNVFILEMRVGGVYRELYFEPYPPLEPHVFIPIHEAFKKLCPPALELD